MSAKGWSGVLTALACVAPILAYVIQLWTQGLADLSLQAELQFHIKLCYGTIGMFLLAAVLLLAGVTAPYGRYYNPSSGWFPWGPPIPPLSAWVIQESPALFLPLYFTVQAFQNNGHLLPTPNLCFLTMFMFHYTYRALIFPLRLRSDQPLPFLVVLMAFSFCCVNGYIQGRYFSDLSTLISSELYPDNWLTQPCFLAGTSLFIIGWMINFHSDNTLFQLRDQAQAIKLANLQQSEQKGDRSGGGNGGKNTISNKSHYIIPTGGMFHYVSGANYFGEILE